MVSTIVDNKSQKNLFEPEREPEREREKGRGGGSEREIKDEKKPVPIE